MGGKEINGKYHTERWEFVEEILLCIKILHIRWLGEWVIRSIIYYTPVIRVAYWNILEMH